MLGFSKKLSRGDTIVEVLFAVTIFSALAISGLSVMNRGVGTAQRSLEISLVRQEMNNQAEILRFVHNAYATGANTPPAQVWRDVTHSSNVIPRSSLGSLSSLVNTCSPPTSRAFVINPKTLAVANNSTNNLFRAAPFYSQLRYTSANNFATNGVEGIWIQQLQGSDTSVSNSMQTTYRDFHIRACWSAPGNNVPVTLGTVVRLYDTTN